MRKISFHSTAGFTLIEVLIATAILATLSILTTSSIQQSLRSKAKVQNDVDSFAQIRDVVHVMKHDIYLAFHYRDFAQEIQDEIDKERGQNNPSTPGGFTESVNPMATPKPDISTHFMGEENKMNFVTMNTVRTYQDSKQSDYIEVGYYIDQCRSKKTDQNVDCLWRRSSVWVDEDIEKGGESIPLLENIKEFELKYFGTGKEDWVTSWKTTTAGDSITKGNFPEAIQISLTVQENSEENSKKYSLQYVFPIRFPNNSPTTTTGGNYVSPGE